MNLGQTPSLNTQSCIRRPLCSTFRFENLRSPKKNEFFQLFSTFCGLKKFFFIKVILCNFSVRTLGYFQKNFKTFFCLPKHEKTALKSCSESAQALFFQYCQPAQNLPKSHFLFHKNVSLRDFYIMTLPPLVVCSP